MDTVSPAPSDKSPHIAYISLGDPHDRRPWSGGIWSMARALERHAGRVTCLGPADERLEVRIGSKIASLVRRVTGKRYAYQHSLFWARRRARFFERKLAGGQFDVIFAPAASSILAFLETAVPIISLSDATFAALCGYNEDFCDLLESSVRSGNELEKRTLGKSARAVYPSRWAADSAVRDYGMAPERVVVYPLGANIDDPPTRDEVLARPRGDVCRLLFLGRNWPRKGGPIALDALIELERRGIAATLTVVGCVPPLDTRHPRMEVIPFINKNDPDGRRRFRELLLSSDFLVLPTRMDCFGYVFAEASAFGLFSFATDTGGVPGAVRDGDNGCLLPFSAGGAEWAQAIAAQFSDGERYAAGRRQARAAFEERLNWDAWGERTAQLIREVLRERSR